MTPAAYLRAQPGYDRSGLHCKKVPYPSRREALKAAKQQNKASRKAAQVGAAAPKGLNTYQCVDCGLWHNGTWPQKHDKLGLAKAKSKLKRMRMWKAEGDHA